MNHLVHDPRVNQRTISGDANYRVRLELLCCPVETVEHITLISTETLGAIACTKIRDGVVGVVAGCGDDYLVHKLSHTGPTQHMPEHGIS